MIDKKEITACIVILLNILVVFILFIILDFNSLTLLYHIILCVVPSSITFGCILITSFWIIDKTEER